MHASSVNGPPWCALKLNLTSAQKEVGAMKAIRAGVWLWGVISVGLIVAQVVGEFALKALELKGKVETQLPDGSKAMLKAEEKLPPGSVVRTQAKSMVVLEWLPYKARVKLAPETEVQLLITRALSLQRGRIWVGTPPPPVGERRFPLPVQCRQVQIVSSPDAIFSLACQPDGTVTVSVDQGAVFLAVEQKVITVPKARMVILTSQNIVIGPMPLTKQELLMWDMGGVR